jgi:hypothetical protein
MALKIDGQVFYTTSEACQKAGTNRFTFLRWVKTQKFTDVGFRNHNGWRLFTQADINRLKATRKVVMVKNTLTVSRDNESE